MTTALIPLDTLGATIRAHVAKGDASIEKAEQHYKSAGLHLAEAKSRVKSTPGLTWPRFLHEQCQIRRSRADELIMIADGRTTLADLRVKKAESVRATRERKTENLPLRSGENVSAITEVVATGGVYSDDAFAAGAVLSWLSRVSNDDESREAFLRKLGPLISDWFVPKHWFEDCAYELHKARGTAIPEALAVKKAARM